MPAAPKLYKVAMHHVLVGIPTYKVTTTVLVLNSKESTTAYTTYTTYTTVLSRFQGSQTHCNRFDTINLHSSKCYLFVLLLLLDYIATTITSE